MLGKLNAFPAQLLLEYGAEAGSLNRPSRRRGLLDRRLSGYAFDHRLFIPSQASGSVGAPFSPL